jgi:bifunctional DNA primase/polymerase-like protein
MREILGKLGKRGTDRTERTDDEGWAQREAALRCAWQWGWPVVPGAGMAARGDGGGGCGCARGECAVPGAHPFDPQLLAATTDVRMVGWWWTARPTAPIVLATGGRAPCALSLPAVAGAWAMEELDRQGVRPGPVVATPARVALLVQPYELAELGELLGARGGQVPGSLRFHGEGGYLPLPPSRTGAGRVRWLRPPERCEGRVTLPSAAWLLDVVVEAGISLGVLSDQQ